MALRQAISSPFPAEQIATSTQDEGHDANFALMELEKGLRSAKIGEQCEAIVNVPALLQKHPYPILVNSTFLKLGEVFRTGSNFIKLCVLKAIQSSKKHLEKIFNVDEFSRRFFTVIHSNDPIARAVTLRIFGNISSIVSDRKNIHHCIRTSLDSHDTVEVEAAIYATKCFAEQSGTFAEGIWQKVADMIQGLSTPTDMKLKLLPVLKYMYHDVNTANQVSQLCKNLLKSYPACEFVATILNTSTQLALSALINLGEHLELLLQYVKNDPRKSINLIAVKNMLFIAKKAPHLWKAEHVDNLLTALTTSMHVIIKQKSLQVIALLTESGNASEILSGKVLLVLEELSSDLNIEIASLALETRVLICCSGNDSQLHDHVQVLEGDIEMLISLSLCEDSLRSFKRCLHSAEVLLMKGSIEIKPTLVSFFIECLNGLDGDFLLECLHMLVTVSTFQRDLCSAYNYQLLTLVEDRIHKNTSMVDRNVLVAMLTLIMQSTFSKDIVEKLSVQQKLLHNVSVLNANEYFWTVFKMSRQASRLVYPDFASKLLNLLSSKVSSENLYYWLKALSKFQEGESVLMKNVESVGDLQDMLMSAHNCYQDGLTNLKAAVTTDYSLYFQFKYARLRSDMLRAYSHLLTCCSSMKLNPPPSLARASSLSTGQEVHHLSRISTQFQNCAAMFHNISSGYQRLFKSSFNSDPTSLHCLQTLQESMQLFVYAIETLVTQRSADRVNPDFTAPTSKKNLNMYLQHLTETNASILNNIKIVDQETKEQALSHHQINGLSSMVLSQLRVGYTYPLYFFKSLQNINLQVSVTPCNNTLRDEPYLVNINHEMALKIEGVLIDESKSSRFRQVSKVNLTVKVNPAENIRNASNDIKPVQNTEMILKESCELKNDYFSSQFLLPFTYVGRHYISIHCGVCDQQGVDWDTGPNRVIHLEVYEHGGVKKK